MEMKGSQRLPGTVRKICLTTYSMHFKTTNVKYTLFGVKVVLLQFRDSLP